MQCIKCTSVGSAVFRKCFKGVNAPLVGASVAWIIHFLLFVQATSYMEKGLSSINVEEMVSVHALLHRLALNRTHMQIHTYMHDVSYAHTHAHTYMHSVSPTHTDIKHTCAHVLSVLSPQPLPGRFQFCSALEQAALDMNRDASLNEVSCSDYFIHN